MIRKRFLVILGVLAMLGAGCENDVPPPPKHIFSPVSIIEPEDGATLGVNDHFIVKVQFTYQGPWEDFYLYYSINGNAATSQDCLGCWAADSVPLYGYTNWHIGEIVTAYDSTLFYKTGEVTITVRAKDADSNVDSPYSDTVHVTVGEYVAAPGVVVTPAVIEIGPSPTPTIVIIHNAFALMNANCRAGPGTTHNETGYISKGSTVEVVGRNADGTWLKVVNPNGVGLCWASMIAFEMQFDAELIPVDATIPTAPSPVNGEEAEQTGCTVTNPLNNQTRCESPCPPGAVPGTACTP